MSGESLDETKAIKLIIKAMPYIKEFITGRLASANGVNDTAETA